MAVWRLHGMMVPSVMVMLGLARTAACSPSIGVVCRRAPSGELSGASAVRVCFPPAPTLMCGASGLIGRIRLPCPEYAMIGAVAGVCWLPFPRYEVGAAAGAGSRRGAGAALVTAGGGCVNLLTPAGKGRLIEGGLGLLAMAIQGVEPDKAQPQKPDQAQYAELRPHRHLAAGIAGNGGLPLLNR